jgi:diguanylate cyclase (GGDEF)-like protein
MVLSGEPVYDDLALATPAGAERFKVMIVDDEPVNRQVLANQLALHNYKVVEAAGGEEALKVFDRESPDLVLLDIMMPRISGYDVCRRMREERQPSEMPVIYLSAKNQVRDILVGFETGANDYLTKPVSKAELLARVGTHLDLLDVHRNLEQKVVQRTEELRHANELLARLASLDGLTGVANRRSFDEALARHWADHEQRQSSLSLILMDIDYFKRFNDHYGHQRGDEVLRSVAQTIHSSLRTSDLAARYGGEEFVAVLPDMSMEGANVIAARILDAVRALNIPHERSDADVIVTLSLGVATMTPSPDIEPAAFIVQADEALYRAKGAGRNRVAS